MYQEVHFFAHENRLQYKNIRTVGTMRFSRHANVVPSYALCARKMRTYLLLVCNLVLLLSFVV